MIRLEGVGKVYPGAAAPALDGVDLEVRPGEVFGVIGPSGAGKSTLIRLLNGLERPSAGRVTVDGLGVAALDAAGLRALRRRVGMIFQHFALLSSRTVAGNVAYPLRLAGTPTVETARRVAALLERVGLADHADRYPAKLSGGQKQRVGVARALATGPTVLLCDEATSALDPETTEQVLALLSDLNRELGLTLVLITHEMDVIRRVCDRVAVLDRGRVVETGEVAEVFLHPRHPITRGLVRQAEPRQALDLDPAAAVPGGPVLRLTFRGEATYLPILGRIARETGVDYSILSGRIARIRETPYGQLTVALVGGDVGAARRALERAGVRVEAARG